MAAPSDPARLVQLLAIKELANVGAGRGSLPIAEAGLTAIYGENGAGKSGYSRILKHACRARDQRGFILPVGREDGSCEGCSSPAKFWLLRLIIIIGSTVSI